MNKRYEAFVSLPDGREASNLQSKRRWVVAASFQFGDPGKFVPIWLALHWCKSKKEANKALLSVKKRRRYPVIETAVISVKHRLYRS